MSERFGIGYRDDGDESVTDQVRYYRFAQSNIFRVIEYDYAYLDKKTGKWVSRNSLIGPITGIGGDSVTEEVSETEAKAWVTKHHPNLSVDWV